jgi:hypothetical protein
MLLSTPAPLHNAPDGEDEAFFLSHSGDIGVTSELSHLVYHIEEVIATGYHPSLMDGYPLALVFPHHLIPHLPVVSLVVEKVLVQMLLVGGWQILGMDLRHGNFLPLFVRL